MNDLPDTRRLPGGVMRLFPGHTEEELLRPEHRQFLVGRLLEEGDSADLRWLAATFSEAELAGWLAARGGRQLSRRSRAFWRLLLAAPAQEGATAAPAPDPGPGEALWPL